MTSLSYESVRDLLDKATQRASERLRLPRSTYRLQMHEQFTLRDALRIVPYLDRLGVSDLYTSSLLKARPGSLHGYDVVDHSQLNPELGTEADLSELSDELKRRGMGLILDIVPNHMCVGEANQWWMDVLENGAASRFANHFDIAWRNHPRERLRGKVLLPILDEPYGEVILAGRMKVCFEDGRFGIIVDQMRLPVDPRTYAPLLEPVLTAMRETLSVEDESVLELQSVLAAVRHLPPRDDPDPGRQSESLAEGTVIKRRLVELGRTSPLVQEQIERTVRELSNVAEHPESLTPLIQLLDAQPYRPSFWRVALDEINYRRFFDVNDLAGLATERPEVFDAIHAKPLEWLKQGIITGLRVDHIDGLLDPQAYLARLQEKNVIECARELWDADEGRARDDSWCEAKEALLAAFREQDATSTTKVYVVVEKILGLRETVPPGWACHGTTGYEFLNEVNALFVDPGTAEELSTIYRQFTQQTDSFEQICYEGKLQVLRSTMASELHVLAHRLDDLAQMEWWSRDFTLNGLRQALEEMIACFPVYRTYVATAASPTDQLMILRAAQRARRMNPLLGKEIFEFLVDTLLLRSPHPASAASTYVEHQAAFARKFQQLTSPVMAKGVEDTALYEFNRLVSLNEVGGDPTRACGQADRLHSFLQARAVTYPNALSPLSTHDTKRGEDVRARINVLSQIPAEWGQRIRYWCELNRLHKIEIEDGLFAPDPNEEYFIYQTLVGCWPRSCRIDDDFEKRIQAYLVKAMREAKVHTSWILPEGKYEEAVHNFVGAILDYSRSSSFLEDMDQFQKVIRPLGDLNSLSQTLIRCLAPGVPDTYQGCESWNECLVDPDNRRPVDYGALNRSLDVCERLLSQPNAVQIELLRKELSSSNAKLLVSLIALRLRRTYESLFRSCEYVALDVVGPDAISVFAFVIHNPQFAITLVIPRLVRQEKFVEDNLTLNLDANVIFPTGLKSRRWTCHISQRQIAPNKGCVPLESLFSEFPFAILVSRSADFVEHLSFDASSSMT